MTRHMHGWTTLAARAASCWPRRRMSPAGGHRDLVSRPVRRRDLVGDRARRSIRRPGGTRPAERGGGVLDGGRARRPSRRARAAAPRPAWRSGRRPWRREAPFTVVTEAQIPVHRATRTPADRAVRLAGHVGGPAPGRRDQRVDAHAPRSAQAAEATRTPDDDLDGDRRGSRSAARRPHGRADSGREGFTLAPTRGWRRWLRAIRTRPATRTSWCSGRQMALMR